MNVADGVGLTDDVELGRVDAVGDAVLVAPVECEADTDEEVDGVCEPDTLTDGENIAGWVDPPLVHPATAAETTTIKVAAPAAGVTRTFMEPPCMPKGKHRRFPALAFGTGVGSGTENCWSTCNSVFSICPLGYASSTCCGRYREGMALGDARWRRVAGLRVVMSWPDSGYAPPPVPPPKDSWLARIAGLAGVFLLTGGAAALIVAFLSQQHAPQPSTKAAGITHPVHSGPSLPRSTPVTISIPSIGVYSKLLRLGLNPDGTIEVPSLTSSAGLAAWYKYSATPGEIGTSVIEGHVDSYLGPAVFFRLGAIQPGDTIDVTLADGDTAIFRVTGVREYLKANFPDKIIYGPSDFAALRVITCGGDFDPATGHYLSSTVVFASLASYQDARHARSAG